jgi:hypothetical protein
MMERRGMRQPDLRKRGAKLAELRNRLTLAPPLSKPRATIRSPKPFVLELGVYACPAKGSSCINPYLGKNNRDGSPWLADGWRQFVILDRGRAFYLPLVCRKPVQQKPHFADASADLWWQFDTPKTCPSRHFDLMEIATIGPLAIDMDKARARFPKSRPGIVYLGWDGRSAAVNGITLADSMFPSSHDWEIFYEPRGMVPEEGPTIMRGLGELLSE